MQAKPWNVLLSRADGVLVAIHAVAFDAHGVGLLCPVEAGNVYPAGSLTGRGTLGDRTVNCVAPRGCSATTTSV
jgi:lincosamide nucleotidyltransferase A/C/D/E